MIASPPISVAPALAAPGTTPRLPRLENGDHLTRAEFLRRYKAMPEVKKAELIEGVVFMASPVRFDGHGSQHADLIGWLVAYRAATIGTSVGDNSTTLLDLDNTPQPDALLIVAPDYRGRTTREDGYIAGGPELVAEVSGSSASIDLNKKWTVYRRNGVQEYIVWRVFEQQIDWFRLHDGEYQTLDVGSDGILRSEVFPGLWLDKAALIVGDIARVLDVLKQGTTSPEHADFVKLLARHRGS